jgi:RNA polymerase sigma-70 factor (ECF subfamily)
MNDAGGSDELAADGATPDESRSVAATSRAGDVDQEFSEFYRASFTLLVAFLLRQGVPLRDAADIAQLAMIDAHRQWTTIDSPRAWIRRVAGRMWARRIAADLAVDYSTHQPLLTITDIDRWHQEQHVLQVLGQLPPRQRQVLAWTVDGYEPAEIAAELDMTPEAVRSSLRLARRAVAEYLRAGGDQNGR